MNQKTMAITVIVVVVVAVIGVAAYWALSSGGGNGGTPTPTPTPTPENVANADSLQFKVEVTGGESEGTYTYSAKNIGTSEMMMHIDMKTPESDLIEIINRAKQEAWLYMDGEWMDLSSAFQGELDAWMLTWNEYIGALSSWTTGDYTYTDAGGNTIRIYEITINPSLADSLFEP